MAVRRKADSPFVLEEQRFWDRMAHLGSTRDYPELSFIYHQGECSDCFYYVVSGRVKVFVSRPDGSERTLALMEPGTTFGESSAFDGLPYFASAQALCATRVRAFPAQRVLEEMARNPEVAREVVRGLVRKERLLAAQVEAMTFLDATQRTALSLARLFSDYGVPAPGGRALALRMTQDELARVSGTSRVTVSKVVSDLVRRGLVVKHKWELVAPDLDRLWEFALGGEGLLRA